MFSAYRDKRAVQAGAIFLMNGMERKRKMEVNQIPDVHSPDFPNSGVLKWVPDGPTVLARMDRSTVKTYTSFLAYTKTFGPYVDRLGLPYGKYFWQLPENGSPF